MRCKRWPRGVQNCTSVRWWADMTPITIGTQYTDRNKRLCTVTDIWLTYNAAGELVQTRYVASHTFMGQTITERDVLAVTIRKGQAN